MALSRVLLLNVVDSESEGVFAEAVRTEAFGTYYHLD